MDVKDMRIKIMMIPTLQYNYEKGALRFFKLSRDSISALDSMGNRVTFTNDSPFTFNEDCIEVPIVTSFPPAKGVKICS